MFSLSLILSLGTEHVLLLVYEDFKFSISFFFAILAMAFFLLIFETKEFLKLHELIVVFNERILTSWGLLRSR